MITDTRWPCRCQQSSDWCGIQELKGPRIDGARIVSTNVGGTTRDDAIIRRLGLWVMASWPEINFSPHGFEYFSGWYYRWQEVKKHKF